MERLKGHFKVKKITDFETLKEGDEIQLPESDLCFQDQNRVYQFDFIEPENVTKKYIVEPGIYSFAETNAGIALSKMELRERNLLDTAVSTKMIINEARTFFSRLHVYEKLNRAKKRGVLLYSAPGMGKTSAIEKFCHEATTEDAGTVVMVWPTSEIDPDSVARFLSQSSEYSEKCTRLILIIEDIGGGERDQGGRGGVTSGLLNLLDGVGLTFRLPTFIIATTNHPENLLSSLANRPGRFDLMVELQPPTKEERIKLLEFVCKREVTNEEKDAITGKGTEKFSIAHIEEVVVRAELHDKSFKSVVEELVKHAELFNKDFAKNDGTMGFSSAGDDDDY